MTVRKSQRPSVPAAGLARSWAASRPRVLACQRADQSQGIQPGDIKGGNMSAEGPVDRGPRLGPHAPSGGGSWRCFATISSSRTSRSWGQSLTGLPAFGYQLADESHVSLQLGCERGMLV